MFTPRMSFSLRESFPLLTSKRVHWKSVAHELLWIMSGSTNVKDLQQHGVSIWNEWADEDGELGPVYGKQWRSWVAGDKTVDQLQRLVDGLKNDPFGRRHLVSAWNPADIDDMALPPCHCLFQFWVSATDNSLHCQLYQRSADIFLGVPFNIASYALLTCIIADKLGFERGSFTWVGGDVHLYENHAEQARLQLSRTVFKPPTLKKLAPGDPLAVTFDELVLEDYNPHPTIPAPVAV